MKRIKYVIGILLCLLCMGCSKEAEVEKNSNWDESQCVTIETESGKCEGYYSVDKRNFWLLRYSPYNVNDTKKVTLPEQVNGAETVKLGRDSLVLKMQNTKTLDEIEEIIVPDSVQYISYSAFEGLKNLQKIHFPEELLILETCTTGCDNLEEIEISEKNPHFQMQKGIFIDKSEKKVRYILTNEKEVQIPEGVEVLTAFQLSDGVETIHIPASVKELNVRLTQPVQLVVDEKNPYYESKEMCVYDKEKKDLVAVTVQNGEIHVAAGVKSIGRLGYVSVLGTGVEKIYIPKSVERINRSSWRFSGQEKPKYILEGNKVKFS